MDFLGLLENVNYFRVTDFIFPLISIVITLLVFKEDRFKQRVSRYKLARKLISNDPATIINNSLDYFRKKLDSNHYVVNHMVYNKLWIKQKYESINDLMRVNDLKISIDSIFQKKYKKNCRKIIASSKRLGNCLRTFVPYSKLNLVENQLLVGDTSKLWNGNTYGISEVIVSKNEYTKELKVYRGTYYDFYNSCMGYSFEIADGIIRKNSSKYNLRKKFDVFNLENRYCTIGFVVFTIVMVDNDKEYILLHQRGDNVAESKNLINAVPAGAFQPLRDNESIDSEELIANIVKEFGEELKNNDEYETMQQFEIIKKDINYNKIRDNTYYLGCSLNPQNCFLELLILLKMGITSQEFTNFKENYEGKLKYIDFNKENIGNIIRINGAAPALREIANIVYNNFVVFENIPVNNK